MPVYAEGEKMNRGVVRLSNFHWITKWHPLKVCQKVNKLKWGSVWTGKSNCSNPDCTLTVETLLDKLQYAEWNSLTWLHKRGQNPHGESRNRASSSNEAVWLSQSSRWITTRVQLTPCRITCQQCFAVEWFYIHIIYHIVLSLSAFSIPTASLTPTHTHTHESQLPPCYACWCVFHLIQFNEPHFTVRSLMTLIN